MPPPAVLWSDGLTAERQSDSCFGSFAVGERCDLSLKSEQVSAAMCQFKMIQRANCGEGDEAKREKRHAHADVKVPWRVFSW